MSMGDGPLRITQDERDKKNERIEKADAARRESARIEYEAWFVKHRRTHGTYCRYCHALAQARYAAGPGWWKRQQWRERYKADGREAAASRRYRAGISAADIEDKYQTHAGNWVRA